MLLISFEVEAPQEIDGFEILAPAVLVRNPLARIARAIELEHRGDSIHAQSIGMIFVEPEHSARQQKAAFLGAAIIKDECLPVRMEALTHVRVLKQMRTVEKSKPVAVRREVKRHHIKKNDKNMITSL